MAVGRGVVPSTMTNLEITIEAKTEKQACAEDGCSTLLSVYNELDYCALHQPMIIPRMRGKVL